MMTRCPHAVEVRTSAPGAAENGGHHGPLACYPLWTRTRRRREGSRPAKPFAVEAQPPGRGRRCGSLWTGSVDARPNRCRDDEQSADSGSQNNLTLVVRSTTARSECARQVSFRKPCAFWDMPHAGAAAAVLTGEFSECLSSTGCCRSVRRPRVGYRAHADELAV